MKKNVNWKLIGQAAMMFVSILLGGGVAMAAAPNTSFTGNAPGVTQGNAPEAEVTNPINTAFSDNGGATVYPEQSVTSTEAAVAAAAANNKPTPEVYEDQYDKLITEVRIARTPLDQISRRSRRNSKVKAMEFKYGSIDYLPIKTQTSAAFSAGDTYTQHSTPVVIKVTNAGIFNRRDVIVVRGVNGYKPNSSTADTGVDLKLWVLDRNSNTELKVVAVNGTQIGNYYNQVPNIASGKELIRIAKACAELDSQAPGYSILPTSDEQYCQKFMAQVEQSTIDALTAKRYDIKLSDQEEATLADMRLGMEGAFLFGTRGKIIDPETLRNVWFTGGIWNTPGLTTLSYSVDNGSYPLDIARLIGWTKTMFTGPAAGKSDKRVVICGSDLLESLQNLFYKAQYVTNTFKKWDLEFTEFKTTFGSFEFVLDEVFDLHGRSKDGIIIDPDYLDRFTFEPFGRNTLDLNAQGTRDSKAIVLREISAMVLKSPNNHARIEFSS